jgi:flagellar biosynthesis regulator FlaF
MSYAAYTQTQNRTTEAPRDIEYRLLGAVTAALMDADTNEGQVVKRVEAVCWNRDIWSTLRMDLTHPENNLPIGIKGGLLDLAKWVDKETFRILGGDTNKLDGLIEVNKNIMAGLKAASKNSDAIEIENTAT